MRKTLILSAALALMTGAATAEPVGDALAAEAEAADRTVKMGIPLCRILGTCAESPLNTDLVRPPE